jgi:hypothetical protein
VSARPHARSTKNGSKNSLYPHRHFTEQLVGGFGKSPKESNLNYKTSRFLIRQLKSKTEMSSCNNPYTRSYKKYRSLKTQTELLALVTARARKRPWRQTPPSSASRNESSARVTSAELKTSAAGCWRCASRQLRKQNRSTHETKTTEDNRIMR